MQVETRWLKPQSGRRAQQDPALLRWGLIAAARENVHSFVRLRFLYSTEPDLKRAGRQLDDLVKLRNAADYQLASPGPFATSKAIIHALADADSTIALLDAIESDADRRAPAIASIRP